MSPAIAEYRVATPRRIAAAIVALIAVFLGTALSAGPATATTLTWSQMTVAQKESSMVYAMLNLLNQERALYRLPPLYGNYALGNSAGAHTLVMAKDNLMSHQCPGEASPGTRIYNAGYHWSAWGENVGWTTDESITGILNMEKMMFNEVAPYNGHRLNILGHYKNIGISIYFDPVHGKAWYTQDFGTPA